MPLAKLLYEGTSTLVAKSTYVYDWGGEYLQNQSAAATQHYGSYFTDYVVGRGNLVDVLHWDVTDPNNSAKALESRTGYDIDGSIVFTRDALNHQNSISYTDSFSDGNNNRHTFAYPTTATDADGFSSTLQYNFDFGAKTRVQGPPPDNQPNGLIQTFTYDSAARIQQVTTVNNGAYTRYEYGANYVNSYSTVNNVVDEAYSAQIFDGLGRVIASAHDHPTNGGGYSAVVTVYDRMGRAIQQSNPTDTSASGWPWQPTGDDSLQSGGFGWRYTQQTYDWKGRPLITTNTDGTQKEASYSACGCAGSEVVTLEDEVGRKQKVYSDALGRQWKTEILNWDSTVYATTVKTFNARDQLALLRQFQGTDQSGVYQDTTMSYDGYGRLQTKHVPEQDASTFTKYHYNTDDTVDWVTDARGARATYGYNNRHEVTSATHTWSGQPTISLTYEYDAAGNRTLMTDTLGSKSYNYNQLSQLMSETRTFNGVGTFTLSYDYNLAGELKKVTDATNMTINYGYDNIGRVNGVTGSDNLYAGVSNYASNFQYRAWGGLKAMTDGKG